MCIMYYIYPYEWRISLQETVKCNISLSLFLYLLETVNDNEEMYLYQDSLAIYFSAWARE